MNPTELKAMTDHALAELEKAEEAMKSIAAQLEDAQGEIRALLATEQNLRERVKDLEEGLEACATEEGPTQEELNSARALLKEQK